MVIASTRSALINGSAFTKNNADRGGAAMYATVYNIHIFCTYCQTSDNYYYMNTSDPEQLGHIIHEDVIVKDNHCSFNPTFTHLWCKIEIKKSILSGKQTRMKFT